MKSNRKRRNKLKSIYQWHRYVGLFAALFIIFITLSGIALNHTDDLALKKQHISNTFLLDSYNIQPPTRLLQFKTQGHTITQADDLLFINSGNVLAADTPLIGIVRLDEFLLISLTNTLLLIDANNQLIETLGNLDGVPNDISGIGYNKDQQVIIIANGQLHRLDTDLNIEKTTWDYNIHWSTEEIMSESASSAVIQQYKSNIISLETLLLDIHSGRFFGSYGTLFFDLVGVIVLFLALTGVIIWARQRTKQKAHD
jgi:hypothetical protein